MSISISNFGKTLTNDVAHTFTLTNKNGIFAKLTDFGAVLISLFVPDKNGKLDDIVLGFDTLEKYFSNDCCYFGSTVGRNSNRVKNASFVLENTIYHLDANERGNDLHSGFNPYNKRLWNYKTNEENNSVTFSLLSPDGDQGFPGNFNIEVTYQLSDDNELRINYDGICDKDTIANMTNHSYFNLSGHSSRNSNESNFVD